MENIRFVWGSLTNAQKNVMVEGIARSGNKTVDGNNKDADKSLVAEEVELPIVRAEKNNSMNSSFEFDLFISHASEDKESFVRELARALANKGLNIWYDEFALKLGDSLRRSIDKGLSKSKYGVVVLSKAFFEKEWPQKELDALVAREDGKEKVILPVWHGLTKQDVTTYSPLLADRLAVPTEKGVDFVVEEILNAIK